MTSRWHRRDPAVGRPSARAEERLADAVAAEIADLKVRLTEAALRTDAYLEAGEDAAAATVLDEQRALLGELEDRLGAALAAAAVEREAEAVVAAIEAAPVSDPGRRVARGPAVAAAVAAAVALFATLTTLSPPDPVAGLASDRGSVAQDRTPGTSASDGRTQSGAAVLPTDVASGSGRGTTPDGDADAPAVPPVAAELPDAATLSELVQRILGPLGLVELEASLGDALASLPDWVPAPPPLPAPRDEDPVTRPPAGAPSDAPADPEPADPDPEPAPTPTETSSSDTTPPADADQDEDAIIGEGFFQVGD